MSVESVPAGCVLDVTGTLARLGGDKELFLEMAGFYYEDGPRLFANLRDAANAKDAKAVRMSAHALKGLVAGCGGVRAANTAQKAETAGQNDDLTHIDPIVETLSGELDLLTDALHAYHD